MTQHAAIDDNLRIIREAVREFRTAETISERREAAVRFVPAFEAMDRWLAGGGWLPSEWREAVRI